MALTPSAYRSSASEGQILQAVLRVCRMHRAVAFAWRANTGAAMLPGRGGKPQRVRFGFPGQSDILGALRGGRLLALEVKRPGGRLTPEQRAFLEAVERAGGLSAVVHSGPEALALLDAALEEEAA